MGLLQKDDKCNAGPRHFNSTSSGHKLLFCNGQNWKVSVQYAHIMMLVYEGSMRYCVNSACTTLTDLFVCTVYHPNGLSSSVKETP